MTKKSGLANFPPLVKTIVEGMQNVKAQNIVILKLTELDIAVCDYFIIGEGNSNTQVSSIAGGVEKHVQQNLQDKPWHIEGKENSEWVLMDYVHCAVHVFQKETREFYDLEGLWNDAEIVAIEN